MKRIQLSQNFYLDEFTHSQTAARRGIDNQLALDTPVHSHLLRLCRQLLQPLRDALGPVYISSGYRSPSLNRAIGGSKRSQHTQGQAADIIVRGHSPYQVCRWVEDNLREYDQLIHEYGEWTHLSCVNLDQAPRRMSLTAYRSPTRRLGFGRKTHYIDGIHQIERIYELLKETAD